jgi:hypothetical protein
MNEYSGDPAASPDPATPLTASSVSDTAKAAWDTTRQKAGEALQSGETYLKVNPGSSALSLFGLGFLIGLLIGWSLAHEEQCSYARLGKRWAGKLHLD